MQGSIARRTLLRGSATVAGFAAFGTLAACGQKAAAPAKGPAPIVITYAPWGQSGYWKTFAPPGIQKFESAHKGIQVKLANPGAGGQAAQSIAGGAGPDVFQDHVIAPYLEQNLVMDVTKYMQQDGVKPDLWSPGQMRAMSFPEGTFFLPAGAAVEIMAVNLSNLDAWGLPYPDPEWDLSAAKTAWTAATLTKAGQSYHGAAIDFGNGTIGSASTDTRAWAYHIYGGSVMDDTRTVCTMDSAEVLQATEFWFGLHWDQVVGSGNLATTVTYQTIASNQLLMALQNWGNSFKWTFFPVPKYPNGQLSFMATGYNAINVATKYPEQAWELLKYLSAGEEWQMLVAQYTLLTPSLVNVWDQYISLVEQVAPIAKQLHVDYFAEAAKNWGLAGRVFKYQDAQAVDLINVGLQQAYANNNESPAPQLQALTRAVNALEQQGAQLAASISSSRTSRSGSSSS